MVTTVVFDLDDTLYDELDYCRSGFKAVSEFLAGRIASLPAGRIYDRLWAEFSAGNHEATFNAALDALGQSYDDQLISRLVTIYRTHKPEITLPPDSLNVLDLLSTRYTLALLTDGYMPAQQLKVQALGIAKYFKCVIYTELLGRHCWKPSSAGFEEIIRRLNTRPRDMAYVADNPIKDFIAPNALGILTIQVLRPGRLHKQTAPDPVAQPRLAIQKISDLPDLLQKLSDHRPV